MKVSGAEVFGLFPVPVLRCPATLNARQVSGLVELAKALPLQDNNASGNLSHTRMLKPSDSPLLVEAAARVTPRLTDFGVLLFGERLGWSIKEMWVNVLETGGRQAMHNHANSFVSGVVYLTATHPESQTVFMRAPGGVDFCFKNDHAGSAPGEFCADKWISPQPEPGDLVLFPSYLMHAVPPNAGGRRVTLAFNAIPARLNSWGYGIGFSG